MTTLLESVPTYTHAELHEAYRPKPRDPRADEACRIASSINELKVSDPSRGQGIHDHLVDQLISNSLQLAKQHETDEPSSWTAPQRVVWRSDALPKERLHEVVTNRQIATDIKAFAEVNNGRWLVRCPLMTKLRQPCMGAQYASWLDRKFWCVSCFNEMVGSRWCEVIWPTNVREIERVLNERPEDARHWVPGETIDELLRQNEIATPIK